MKTLTRLGSAGACVVVAAALLSASATPAEAARVNAVCKNTTTDAATIQSAINSSAVGDEIVIDGPCVITQTIKLLGGRGYRGDSQATTLTMAAGANLDAMLASDSWVDNSTTTGEPISLRDLTINANKANNSGAKDAVVIRSWNSDIYDLRIADARANGLVIAGSSRNGTEFASGQTQVQGTIHDVYVSGAGANGIYVQDKNNGVTDWMMSDNWIGGSGQNAISMDNAAGWMVVRNHTFGVGASGIRADRLYASTISDNYVEDFASSGYGIGVSVQGGAASTIAHNRVFQSGTGTGTTFIAITGVNYDTGNVSVSDNVVRGNGKGTGLSYSAGSKTLRVASSGNLVTDVTTPRSGVAPVATY